MSDLWLTETYGQNTRFSMRIEETLYRGKSEYQDVLIAKSVDWGRVMFLDGFLMLTERDEFIYHEMLAHVPMSSHADPKRVLVIGGGDGGTVREVLKHDPEHVDLVEIDSLVVETSKKYLPFTADCLTDERVHVHYEDGAKWAADHSDSYDVILVDSTDPVGPGAVLFQSPFYKDCKAALREGGVFANQSEGPVLDPELVRRVYGELHESFEHVHGYMASCPTYPMGTWTLGWASRDMDVAEAIERAAGSARPLETRYYHPALHRACFTLPGYIQKLTQRT